MGNKLNRPDLVCGHMQESLRDKARPLVIAGTIMMIIILGVIYYALV